MVKIFTFLSVLSVSWLCDYVVLNFVLSSIVFAMLTINAALYYLFHYCRIIHIWFVLLMSAVLTCMLTVMYYFVSNWVYTCCYVVTVCWYSNANIGLLLFVFVSFICKLFLLIWYLWCFPNLLACFLFSICFIMLT